MRPTSLEPSLILVTGPPGSGKSTLAEALASELAAPVLGWDWGMAALTGFEPVMAGVGSLDWLGYRRLGWQMLWSFAEAQLREGRSAILEGVAREEECVPTRELAARCGARSLIVTVTCSDLDVARARIDHRQRKIPGWEELTWESVCKTLERWEVPAASDLVIDTSASPPIAELVATVLS